MVKEGKNQKTLLSAEEEQKITDTFNKKEAIDDFSVVLSYEDIKLKNYSFSAGQYFEVKIEYNDISHEEFEAKMNRYKTNLKSLFVDSKELETEIKKCLEGLDYES
nr:N-6 DNA methylase [uncultured Marinifilum sp.]